MGRGGGLGRGATVSHFFYEESKSNKKNIFLGRGGSWGGGEGGRGEGEIGGRVSDFFTNKWVGAGVSEFFFTMNPNSNIFFFFFFFFGGGGGGGGGGMSSRFF